MEGAGHSEETSGPALAKCFIGVCCLPRIGRQLKKSGSSEMQVFCRLTRNLRHFPILACLLAFFCVGGVELAYSQSLRTGPERPGLTRVSTDEELSHFLANPPPRYRGLDPSIRTLLGRSVLEKTLIQPDSRRFTGPTLWQFIDERMNSAHLQTLVQVRFAARELGVWSQMERLRSIYYGSSWGVDFFGNANRMRRVVASDQFCGDWDLVRRWHARSRHAWFRHLGDGPGALGFHFGLDAGEGYHNLHLDSTNPANGHLPGSHTCTYSVPSVVSHNIDISSAGGGFPVPFARRETERYLAARLLRGIEEDVRSRPPRMQTNALRGILHRVRQVNAQMNSEEESLRAFAVSDEGMRASSTGVAPSFLGTLLSSTQDFARSLREQGVLLGFFPDPDSTDAGILQEDAAVDVTGHSLAPGRLVDSASPEIRAQVLSLDILVLRQFESIVADVLTPNQIDELYRIARIYAQYQSTLSR